MFISNGYVYGGMPKDSVRISHVKPLPDWMMLITFSTGETRLFDATILSGPAFAPLKQPEVFQHPEVEHGVVTWLNGEIDCGPEFMYQNSFEYSAAS